jgi:hypothetical protein
MTSAIARHRTLTQRDSGRREYRLFGRRAARPQREPVLHARDNVGILLSFLVADDEPEV